MDAYYVPRVHDNRYVSPHKEQLALSSMHPRAFAVSFLLPVLPVLLIGLIAIPFAPGEEILMAAGLAAIIVAITDLPMHLISGRQDLRLTLVFQLMAILFRLCVAVVCAALLSPHYTEAFILIFSLSLSLSIIFDAVMISIRSQEPVHA